jgi:hypothetical protein
MEAHVFALGQGPERVWKANEAVKVEGKIGGPKFKRAELANQRQEGTPPASTRPRRSRTRSGRPAKTESLLAEFKGQGSREGNS